MKHTLPKLNYAYDALEPYIDAKTMEIHHTKHHQAYIDKLNAALEKYPDLAKKTPEELLKNINTIPEEIKTAVRNHGGAHVNHSSFWNMLSPKGGQPSSELKKEIEKTFTSLDALKEQMNTTGLNRFGSGWTWLVINKGKLEVISTPNQDSPLMEGKTPLLGIDIWEHAYYLKYQNKRADYLNAIWSVINWNQVNKLFKEAK